MDDGTGEDFHSSRPFLDTFREMLYPGRSSSVEQIEVDGAVYRVAIVGRQPVIYAHEYPCYLSPLAPGAEGRAWPGLRIRLTAGRIEPVHPTWADARVAPLIDWYRFATFDEYTRARDLFRRMRTARNRRNHLNREVGPVEIVENDTVPGVLDLVLGWKAAQAQRRGWRNVFALERTRNMYRALQERGLQQLTTLRIGGRVVAGSAWTRWNGRLSWRLTAQDPEFAAYPMGTIVFHHLLRQSFEAGDREFDLLIGAEGYKLRHATHLRRLKPAGAPYEKRWANLGRWPGVIRAVATNVAHHAGGGRR
jgi:hypothetical protein